MKNFICTLLDKNEIFSFPIITLRGDDKSNGDLDVLVPENCNNIACFQLIKFLRENNWQVIAFRELDYLSTITIVNLEKYPNKSIKIDFFCGVGWLGINNKKSAKPLFAILQKADTNTAASALTLAHKLMYAGRFFEKDIIRLKRNIKESITLLDIQDLVDANSIFNNQISLFLKWRIRFRLSGYKSFMFIYWIGKVVHKYIKFILRYNNLIKNELTIYDKNGIDDFVPKQFLEILSSSGDKILPTLVSSDSDDPKQIIFIFPKESYFKKINIDISGKSKKNAIKHIVYSLDKIIFNKLSRVI